MKIKALIMTAAMPMLLWGCKEVPDTVSNIPDEAKTAQPITAAIDAESVTNALQAKGLPMKDIIILTEKTDDNKLMGRPGQYVSKSYFADSRHLGDGMYPDEQNSVEVFANEKDATKRREYIDGVIKEMPIFTQYLIQSGPVLVRLDKVLSPSEAKEYESALKAL